MRRAGGARSPPHHKIQNGHLSAAPQHRELRSLRLFRASHSCGICARTPWRMARYRVVREGGRARLPQALLAKNKRRSERSSRCAARAALDLRPTTNSKTDACQPHRNYLTRRNPANTSANTAMLAVYSTSAGTANTRASTASHQPARPGATCASSARPSPPQAIT